MSFCTLRRCPATQIYVQNWALADLPNQRRCDTSPRLANVHFYQRACTSPHLTDSGFETTVVAKARRTQYVNAVILTARSEIGCRPLQSRPILAQVCVTCAGSQSAVSGLGENLLRTQQSYPRTESGDVTYAFITTRRCLRHGLRSAAASCCPASPLHRVGGLTRIHLLQYSVATRQQTDVLLRRARLGVAVTFAGIGQSDPAPISARSGHLAVGQRRCMAVECPRNSRSLEPASWARNNTGRTMHD